DEIILPDRVTIFNVNDPPFILGASALNCWEDELFFFDMDVADHDPEDTHTWHVDTDALFLSIDRSTGNLSGTPGNQDIGPYFVTVTVSDAGGLTDEIRFNLTVQNVNDPPLMLHTLPDEFLEDVLIDIELEALDVDPTDDVILWSMSTNCSFLTLGKLDGTLKGTPCNDDVGYHYLVLNVSDGLGGYSEMNHTFRVVNTNDRPEVVNPAIVIRIHEDGVHYESLLPKWFNDVDGDPLEFQHTVPSHFILSITDDDVLVIETLKDYNGDEMITIVASDGELNVEWSFSVQVLPVNDAPTNVSIILKKDRFAKGDEIVLTGFADDVDLVYGDELTYRWYTYDGSLLGTGRLLDLDLDVGIHEIILNVTDQEGSGIQTSVFIEVYEETTFMGAYGALLIVLLVIFLLIIFGVIIFVVKRSLSRKEREELEKKVDPADEHLSIGSAGSVYSSSLLGGSSMVRTELTSIMNAPDVLPPPVPAPVQQTQEYIGELPPATQPLAVSGGSMEYVRPNPLVSDGFRAPPPSLTGPLAPPSQYPQSQEVPLQERGDVQSPAPAEFDAVEQPHPFPDPVVEEAPQQPEGEFHQDNTHIWSPEMVESRMSNEAKSAVELLHELNQLKNEGAITEEEYQIHKKRLLRKI
ncbi:MAG: putative Ig domain-containing protein, partial [Thermoplasmata archaeon]|nr:putative Ig domain-containing protein [Thermoplasmata archaeon]